MHVDHEIDEGAFKFRAGPSETDKTAPAEFRRPLGIQKIQSCPERNVIGRLCELRFLSPAANDPICARVFANWNALMRQVRNLKKRIVLRRLGSRRSRIQFGNLIADLANTVLKLIRYFAARPFSANLLAQPITVGVQLLQRRLELSAFRIHMHNLIDFRFIAAAARGQPRTHKIGLLPNQTDVEHGADYQRS
jgi:hypothetical protein